MQGAAEEAAVQAVADQEDPADTAEEQAEAEGQAVLEWADFPEAEDPGDQGQGVPGQGVPGQEAQDLVRGVRLEGPLGGRPGRQEARICSIGGLEDHIEDIEKAADV